MLKGKKRRKHQNWKNIFLFKNIIKQKKGIAILKEKQTFENDTETRI